jgi:predicted nucleic acid-binding protein
LHVHDLRHTVGERLREAEVDERTIGDILWHGAGSITAHYSVAKFFELYNALERLKELKEKTGRRNPSILSLLAEARRKRRPNDAL